LADVSGSYSKDNASAVFFLRHDVYVCVWCSWQRRKTQTVCHWVMTMMTRQPQSPTYMLATLADVPVSACNPQIYPSCLCQSRILRLAAFRFQDFGITNNH